MTADGHDGASGSGPIREPHAASYDSERRIGYRVAVRDRDDEILSGEAVAIGGDTLDSRAIPLVQGGGQREAADRQSCQLKASVGLRRGGGQRAAVLERVDDRDAGDW